MSKPKDFNNSMKSISSPVKGLCNLGQEWLHWGQEHRSNLLWMQWRFLGHLFFWSTDLEILLSTVGLLEVRDGLFSEFCGCFLERTVKDKHILKGKVHIFLKIFNFKQENTQYWTDVSFLNIHFFKNLHFRLYEE